MKICRCNYQCRQTLKCLAIVITILGCAVIYLLVPIPDMVHRTCPAITLHHRKYFVNGAKQQDEILNKNEPLNCMDIMDGDKETIERAEKYNWCHQSDSMTLHEYMELWANCSIFKRTMGYEDHVVSREELQFPLAFGIVMHDGVIQVERLIRAIYRKHNFYSIHLDKKSPSETQSAMRSLVQCFDNIALVPEPVSVRWAEFTVLQAEIANMNELLKWSEWKYFINLVGSEFPLRTNSELVDILKAYNGSNDIDGNVHRLNRQWFEYVWYTENWRTNTRKEPPPHKFLIAKGSTHIAASRAFVGYALNDDRAKDLLEWMRDIRVPDEHFFATLNHNPTKDVPGAYTKLPSSKNFLTRFKLWQNAKTRCNGRWIRFVCNFGPGDLQRVIKSKALFVNKFDMKRDYIAFNCIEQWHRNKTKYSSPNELNISFYENQPWVKYHV